MKDATSLPLARISVVIALCAIVAALLLATMTLAGSGPEFLRFGQAYKASATTGAVVATVNGREIREGQVALTVSERINLRGEQAAPASLRRPAIDELVRDEAVYQAALKAGISVTDAEAAANLKEQVEIAQTTESFRSFLAGVGKTPEEFASWDLAISRQTRALTIARYRSAVIGEQLRTDPSAAWAAWDTHVSGLVNKSVVVIK